MGPLHSDLPRVGAMRRRTDPESVNATDPAACREAALKLLERTRRTRSDLARRLKDKGYAPETITEVIDRLGEVGLVDDTEFARAWLAGRWGRRPSGWRRLQQELRARGVSDEDVERARQLLAARDGAPDEVEAARKLIEQTARRFASLDERTRRNRVYALLARRGFDSDVIRQALAVREPSV